MRTRKGIVHAGGSVVRAIELDFAIEHFLARKAKRGCATNTLRAYGADLADLQGYLAGHGITLLGLVAERHVEGWADDLAGRKLSARSIARHLVVLRQLIAHALTEGWITHDPANATRVKVRTRRVVAPEAADLRRVIDQIAPIGWQALRDRALLSLMFDAALRVSAVCALDVPGHGTHTVDLQRMMVHAPDKGGGDGTVCIGETTVKRLRDWIAARPALEPRSAALFVTSRRERFSRQGVALLVQRRGAQAGVVGLHPHLFRHRRIGDVIETMGVDVASAHARHRHVSTTLNVYGGHTQQVIHARMRAAGDVLQGRVGQ